MGFDDERTDEFDDEVIEDETAEFESDDKPIDLSPERQAELKKFVYPKTFK